MSLPGTKTLHEAIQGRTIVLAVTGSIAAYKAADLASRLHQLGAKVCPVLTTGAAKFISPLTFQALCHQPVACDPWSESDPRTVAHVDLADRAELLLVAPASANTLARLTHGLADDFLGALYLVNRAPVLLAPAMNGKMWLHPATQANQAILRNRGHRFVGPDSGMQACGYEGTGRLSPVEEIIAVAAEILGNVRNPNSQTADRVGP
jgi:phosphopantothenoylcysteine decarboxylase